MKLSEFLEEAWKKIEDRDHWTQFVYARDEHNIVTFCPSARAVKFCATGACRRLDVNKVHLSHKAIDLLDRAAQTIYSRDIVSVNDGFVVEGVKNCHAAVRACYELAIEWAKEQENDGREAS